MAGLYFQVVFMKCLIISSFVPEFRMGCDVLIAGSGVSGFLLSLGKAAAFGHHFGFFLDEFLRHFLQVVAVYFCEVS